MSISCGYLPPAGLHPRLRRQPVPRQRQQLRLQQHLRLVLRQPPRLQQQLQPPPQPQLLLRPHQPHQLLLLPGRRQRRDLSRRPGRAPRHDPGCSYCALSPCWHPAASRQVRGLQSKSLDACSMRIFRFRSSHQLIRDNSRQDCCSGVGKRASAAIRDDESEIRNRARFNASRLQPLHIL